MVGLVYDDFILAQSGEQRLFILADVIPSSRSLLGWVSDKLGEVPLDSVWASATRIAEIACFSFEQNGVTIEQNQPVKFSLLA